MKGRCRTQRLFYLLSCKKEKTCVGLVKLPDHDFDVNSAMRRFIQELKVQHVENMQEASLYGPNTPISFTGEMTAYKATCVGCTGKVSCPPRQDVRNGNYQTVAHVRSDGTVQDGNYRTIGHVKRDGTVQDGSYRTIGHIKSDGTVQDGSYRTVGHAQGVGRNETAALLFFFGLLR